MGPEGASRRGVRATRLPLAATLTGAGWLIGLVVTSLILGTPYFVFGYHSPEMHLILDSIDGCVALLVAYLLYGRFLRSDLLRDLLLAEGLGMLAVASLGPTVLFDILQQTRPETLQVWLPLTLRSLGVLLLLGAALSGHRRVGRTASTFARIAPWLFAGLCVVVLLLARDSLPQALEATRPASAQHPVITGHPLILAGHATGALAFAVGSVVFTREAIRRPGPLLVALGPAFALGACARINYLLFPSLYSDWLYTGDILRTASYFVLLVGAAREISHFWSAQTRAAVLEDRRRLARELHDGVVQELGYIRSEAQAAPDDGGRSARIVAACDRALDESRGAVDALGRSPDQPLSMVLHQAARQVAERYGGQLDVDLDDSVIVESDQRHALVRIAREAVSNALRHGHADRVRIRLARDLEGRHLVVEDDGQGFEVDRVGRAGGYGLTSMRDRAAALPGSFRISSTPGRGTQVDVTW
jgi:signal transduction histidine kinase